MTKDQNKYPINYPRNRSFRWFFRFFGGLICRLLLKIEFNGMENFPEKGPLILAGNHVGALEAVLMGVFSPLVVEFLGTGDLPIEKNYAPIAYNYGYIPVKRGSVDRKAMKASLGVLAQEGVIGIFPEGGIWALGGKMKAKLGVALLSNMGNVPVLPIGFSGMEGAIQAALSFKRPRVTMNVGKLIPPVTVNESDERDKKEILQEGANHILKSITDLLVKDERSYKVTIQDESFDFEFMVKDRNGGTVQIPENLCISNPPAAGQLMHQAVILDTFSRLLKMPTQAYQVPHTEHNPQAFIDASEAILQHISENAGIFTYRYGMETGLAMNNSVREILAISQWALENDYTVYFTPLRRYFDMEKEEDIVETHVAERHKN